MRICLVYDCLFPHTVGGAERWYRNLAERLAAEGHEVSYLTLRQWERGFDPGVPGVNVVEVGPRLALYTGSGRRRILPPLVFGLGVLWHLLRRGGSYDIVHTASFPYFSLLAAALSRPRARFTLVVDWHEVWTLDYWREYLGPIGGRVGWLVQRLCLRAPQHAFCFSQLHARRAREEGLQRELVVLEGEYAGPLEDRPAERRGLEVVFAGRFIPEKQVESLVPALIWARRLLPELRARLLGDGPERERVRRRIERERVEGWVLLPGFVAADEVDRALAHALCLVLPSRREGYGMVVIEAASHGTPSVVVAGPDNAAVELVVEGVNGFVAADAGPDALADAIVRAEAGGAALRDSTSAWFRDNVQRLSLAHSLSVVTSFYARR